MIREKARFGELLRPDGSIERKAFSRYFLYIDQRPGEEALLDEEHLSRERKIFTKQRLRSFLKNTISREAWAGAPWIVKQQLAVEHRLPMEIPAELTQEYQARLRKNNNSHHSKKGEYEGPILNFYGPQHGIPILPKGSKRMNAQEDIRMRQEHFAEYQRSLAGNPEFGNVNGTSMQFHPGYHGPPPEFQMANGYHPIASKSQQKPPAPVLPKYPIEDLEIPPARDGTHRPDLKFLSQDTPTDGRVSEGAGNGIERLSVGLLLETWDTLNVYCEVFQLDSFTFDDYVDALRFISGDLQCELLVEIHCAVLKKLVNDVNDKNGQVQVSLPDQPETEEEDSIQDSNIQPTPTPEPEAARPPARSTRSSLVKSEAAELRDTANALSLADAKTHRANEMDHSTRGYDWKMRLRKRDFEDGRWVVILVGLLNQLAGNHRLAKDCNQILAHLAPLDRDPNPGVAFAQYKTLDINLRTRILQIICMKSLETKAIRQYMEDCSAQMTEHRKDKNEVQRSRKAA